ncbi:multidrug effflux MFS transporter [Motiliproteus sp. MSK22-1]|uniref:multidrug effflux MFS transporter n=1 Tax=Motiliproteus sp. MSK22-1 TaxID=1897630 RepID=UPI0009772CEE|nr:multidrug effflux MFS transporter [Motiliproteus sp. MSK22-1]OMH32206.1 MFS transporter [Motiliproteus sp. MSK22-1]
MNHPDSKIDNREFICLMAILMSLLALSIDAMLPALGQIGTSLELENPNDGQLVITTVFLGMAMGLMLYGPLSDSYGRKSALYLGLCIFLVGNLISLFSTDFTFMLIGRIFQGFGAAACRVVTLAMIRDKFEGPEMGRVMSLIMVFFILVPALAPTLGQAVLFFADWRAIFAVISMVGLVSLLWLFFRQPETLPGDKRLGFSVTVITMGIAETLRHPVTRVYMIAAGVIFGSFVGYLSSAQQILQIQYQLGDSFSLYFGGLALAIGLSSFANSKLVMKFSMERLCLFSLAAFSIISFAFLLYTRMSSGHPPLIPFISYLAMVFFCFGILFGNLNTLAVQPLGHIAGVATSVISSIQTLLSIVVGGVIGQSYNGTVQPLVLGFLVCGLSSLAILLLVQKRAQNSETLQRSDAHS